MYAFKGVAHLVLDCERPADFDVGQAGRRLSFGADLCWTLGRPEGRNVYFVKFWVAALVTCASGVGLEDSTQWGGTGAATTDSVTKIGASGDDQASVHSSRRAIVVSRYDESLPITMRCPPHPCSGPFDEAEPMRKDASRRSKET